MKTYRAINRDPEFRNIEQAAQRADPFAELEYLHAEPEKMRAGMFVLCDGVDFNPGSGAGLYRRNEANNAWVFIG
jgi:hypothetical protein